MGLVDLGFLLRNGLLIETVLQNAILNVYLIDDARRHTEDFE